MNWPVIPTMIARLEEEKKLSLERKHNGSSSRRDHTHSLLVMHYSGTSGFLPTAVKSLPNPLSTGQRHNFRGYEERPQSYPVRKGNCHDCGVFGHWRHECKSIQNFRLPKSGYLNPAFLPSPQQESQQQQQQKQPEENWAIKS